MGPAAPFGGPAGDLHRRTVRALAREVPRGAHVLAVRLVISFASSPRPVARFYDLRLRIRRR
jgi:hypothetical protein